MYTQQRTMKDIYWTLWWTMVGGIATWLFLNIKPIPGNPLAQLMAIGVFSSWTIISAIYLVRNIYQIDRGLLPRWLRWIKTKRFWACFFLVGSTFFFWQAWVTTRSMLIFSLFWGIICLLLFCKISWKILKELGEGIPDMNTL